MSDRYASFARSRAGRAVVKRLGLPEPVQLRRYRAGEPVVDGPVLLGGAEGGRLGETVSKLLELLGVPAPAEGDRFAALAYDATGIRDSTGLRALYDFFHPVARSVRPSGRVIVLGTPPEACATPREATAPPANWERPLEGCVALVTGAARGIGAAIAQLLARDGAHVICLDVPAAGDALAAVANEVKGGALQLDLTAADAPERITEYVATRHGRLHALVHNAGITRDKTLAWMNADQWDSVLDVNLSSQERINDALLGQDLVAEGGRIVAVSSVNGI